MLRRLTILTVLFVLIAPSSVSAHNFTLTSPTISEGGMLMKVHVFQGFGCDGENQSPQLAWTGAPKGTKSFAINVYDPDAPIGSGWWHWSVVNIPATTSAIGQNASANQTLPSGALEIRNDYGVIGFGGACPPLGESHRYVITVFALRAERLELPENPSNALVGFMVRANALDRATITAVYRR